MKKQNLIVIGASAGGVAALMELMKNLPLKINATIFIVLHIPNNQPSFLQEILSKLTKIPVLIPKNAEKIKMGCIYVAPPDHHIILKLDKILLSNGPAINRFKPAIDPLFYSAAFYYGTKAIGILLSGTLSDGVAGLAAIKKSNGVTIVQDPKETLHPELSLTALAEVEIDHCVSIKNMTALLVNITTELKTKKIIRKKILKTEIIENKALTSEKELNKLGSVSGFSCPDCSGALWQIKERKVNMYRCRIGHSYNSIENLLSAQSQSLENILWTAVRALEENANLCARVAARTQVHQPRSTKYFVKKAKNAEEITHKLKKILLENDGNQ